jgi:serine/threonine protein kinase/tetratricopeptide (TPR) repeat protein
MVSIMAFTGTARFRVLGKLGEGGMGDVYEVYDQHRGMRLALKHLRRVDGMGLYRFKREFRSLGNLSHPNIIALYELISEGEDWFLTMELVEGVDLLTYVRGGQSLGAVAEETATRTSLRELATEVEVPRPVPRNAVDALAEQSSAGASTGSGPVPAITGRVTEGPALPTPPRQRQALADILDVARLRDALGQLARALDTLHAADLIHRDLKPANVRVTPEGRVVLMDFGVVAEIQQSAALERSGATVGTPAFMAPEQVASGGQLTAAVDWYAFGVLMYLALTGRLPFEGAVLQVLETKRVHDPLPPSLFTEGIPADLERLCMALLARDPARRPSGAEILERLGVGEARKLPALAEPTLDLGSRPFVGRSRELAALRQAFADVRARGALAVLVEGPPGMGKSSLIERFLRELRTVPGLEASAARLVAGAAGAGAAPRPVILSGRCHERETLPYKAFDSVVDALAGVLIQRSEEQRATLLPADLELIERMFPVLRRLSGSDGSRPRDANLRPLEQRERAFAALRELLAGLARAQPVIVQIEDLQWADVDSLELLHALLAPPAPPTPPTPPAPPTPPTPIALLVVATMRSDVGPEERDPRVTARLGELTGNAATRRLALQPLSEAEQTELLARLSRHRQLPAAIERRFLREAGGNPMLLVELARSLEEETGEELGAGLGLDAILWRRVARLPAPVRALLEAVAVAGTPTPLRVLGQAAELSSTDAERAVALLRIGQLVHTHQSGHEPWIGASHDKVREAVAARIAAATARVLHRRLAVALDAWGQAPPALMARHWQAANEPERAATCYIEGARQAAHKLAFERAATLYRQALALLPEAPGDARLAALRCQAWLGLAEDMRIIDRTDEALALLERAEPLAMAHDLIDELATLYSLRGNLLFPRGDLDGCLAAHERARAYAERAGSPEREARALSGLGDAYYMRGHIVSAHGHFVRCIELCRQHGLVDIEVANLAMRGMGRYYQNDLGAALRDCMDAATAAMWVGHQRAEIVARNGGAGVILTEMGRLAEARGELEIALEKARGLGARRFEPGSLIWLAQIAALEGRRDQAEELARRSIAICRETGFAFVGPMALGMLALVTGSADTRAQAIAEAEAALPSARASHNQLYFRRFAMDALLAAGDLTAVERMADALERYTSAQPLPWSRFFVARARALAAWQRGRRDRAIVAALDRLRAEARVVGFFTAVRALDAARAELPATR